MLDGVAETIIRNKNSFKFIQFCQQSSALVDYLPKPDWEVIKEDKFLTESNKQINTYLCPQFYFFMLVDRLIFHFVKVLLMLEEKNFPANCLSLNSAL